jgi:hypothetical protein
MVTRSLLACCCHDLKVCGAYLSNAVARGGRLRISSMLLAVICGLLQTDPAFASGLLPSVPITAGPFPNFVGCLNYVEATYRRQAAMAMPKPLRSPHGGTHQTILSTKGVVRGVGEQATYNAEIGHVNRAIDINFRLIVTSYDWERYTLSCQGAVFTGSQQNGYASQGTEPIPPGKPLVVPSQ